MSALPPPLLLDILADHAVFVAGIVGALIGLAPFALMEWLDQRRKAREARELDDATDYLIRDGFLALERESHDDLPDRDVNADRRAEKMAMARFDLAWYRAQREGRQL